MERIYTSDIDGIYISEISATETVVAFVKDEIVGIVERTPAGRRYKVTGDSTDYYSLLNLIESYAEKDVDFKVYRNNRFLEVTTQKPFESVSPIIVNFNGNPVGVVDRDKTSGNYFVNQGFGNTHTLIRGSSLIDLMAKLEKEGQYAFYNSTIDQE